MRKLGFLLIILAIAFTSAGCEKSDTRGEEENIFYVEWPHYETVESLLEHADYVFEGEIADVFFRVIDIRTGEIVEDGKETAKEDGNLHLYTVYELEVQQAYKGDLDEKIYIKIIGGLPGYKEEAQYAEMEKCGLDTSYGIPVANDNPGLKEGTSYLFVACDLGGPYLAIPSIYQFAFEIDPQIAPSDDGAPNYTNMIHYFEKNG